MGIEIVSDVPLLKVGDKVGMSEATLLNMLKIYPFSYGLRAVACFEEGSIFDPEILDITEDDIRAKFMAGVNRVVAAATDITFPQAEKMKAYLADPSAFASAAPVAAAEETKEEAKKEESEDESDSDMGFDLFG